MYTWTQYEDLTADKLNKMQERPVMDAINRAGVSGGLDGSSLSMETIGGDLGSAGTPPDPIITQENDLGYWRMRYDSTTEQWRLKSGSAGVTGVVVKDAGCETWLLTCTNCKAGNWQHITTDKWGNVIDSQLVIDTCAHTTRVWEPSADDGTGTGDIWRRMGSVYKDERFANVNPSERNQWIYTATNENNALMMPVARHVGWCRPSEINICTAQDVSTRKDNSVWVRTAMEDKGATVPIRSIGELGGTYVYRTTDSGSNEVGIGIASGIEFYDKNTIVNYNRCTTRPNSTTARVDFGSCGKHGFIQISNINAFSPWQFELSGEFDLGSLSPIDIGSDYWRCHINTLPYADGKVCSGFYYSWQGRFADPQPDKRSGIMDGSVTRLQIAGGLTCTEMQRTSSSVGWRVGEIQDGGVGIGTATYMPMGEFDETDPQKGSVMWNPNGGVVTAIMSDSKCRPYIDTDGIIHLPNPCWMGEEGVRCAHSALMSCLRGTMTPMYQWTPPYNDCTSWSCLHQGVVNGKIQSIKPDNVNEFAARKPWNGEQIMYSEVGEIKCGRLGITTAWYDPTYCWWTSSAPDDVTECQCLHYAWQTSGGLIRGIMADIPLSLAKKQPPYIDDKGIIHIVYIDTDAWQCNVWDKKITYKEPRYWDGNPPN